MNLKITQITELLSIFYLRMLFTLRMKLLVKKLSALEPQEVNI